MATPLAVSERKLLYDSSHASLPRTLVHDVPYRKRVKSIRTCRWRPEVGTVMIAGQVKPLRQSSGTQNRSPSALRTHPFESNIAVAIGKPERAFAGRWLLAGLLNSGGTIQPSGGDEFKSNIEPYDI